MDVHAPHEPVHSWRDFAIHLTIVTIGLFIALSLEAFVEHLHNRHLVREARANIRQELEDNHKAAQKDLTFIQQNIERQQANIKAIHGLQDNKHFNGSINNVMVFDSLEDAAWRTARDTGALSFMPYDEVQRYSDLYMLENAVNQRADTTEENDVLCLTPFEMGVDPEHVPAQDFDHMIHDNAAVLIQLIALKQYVQQYDDLGLKDLKK